MKKANGAPHAHHTVVGPNGWRGASCSFRNIVLLTHTLLCDHERTAGTACACPCRARKLARCALCGIKKLVRVVSVDLEFEMREPCERLFQFQ